MVDSLESWPNTSARVCLLLPASDMIFRHFTLPKKGGFQAMAFSWMVEETLIGGRGQPPLDGTPQKGADVDAVVIDADRLRAALTRCQEAGLNVIQARLMPRLLPVTAGAARWSRRMMATGCVYRPPYGG